MKVKVGGDDTFILPRQRRENTSNTLKAYCHTIDKQTGQRLQRISRLRGHMNICCQHLVNTAVLEKPNHYVITCTTLYRQQWRTFKWGSTNTKTHKAEGTRFGCPQPLHAAVLLPPPPPNRVLTTGFTTVLVARRFC